MRLKINGEERVFKEKIENISGLLEVLGVKSKFVAVELNGKVVYRENFSNTVVKEGDKIEVVSFVGGG